jgi:glycosyltransferase involved in cell wall biosynthesis
MKILLVSSSSGSRGGGELYLLYLARALVERGHEPILWAATHPRMDELCALFAPVGRVVRADYTNMYDRRLRSIASHLDLSGARAAADSWRGIAPDFVHLNKQNLEDALDLQRAVRLSDLPSLATIHITQTAAYLRAKNAGMRDWISRRALDAYPGPLVAVLEQRTDDLRAFLGAQPRIRTVANGVELFDLAERQAIREAKRAELGVPADAPLFVAVGRMVPQKRPLHFIGAAKSIFRRVPRARFIWVGDGPLSDSWDATIAKQNLGYAIQRIGWQKNVRDFLFAADVFLHTAEFEGLPLAILEALSAGLPCAVTPNLLTEMPFFEADNSIAVGTDDAWADVFNDPARLRAIGQAGRRLAEERFSFARMAAEYETLYREVLAGRR